MSGRFGKLTSGKFALFRRNLFIKTEPTPNPNSLIYRPENRPILGNDSSNSSDQLGESAVVLSYSLYSCRNDS